MHEHGLAMVVAVIWVLLWVLSCSVTQQAFRDAYRWRWLLVLMDLSPILLWSTL